MSGNGAGESGTKVKIQRALISVSDKTGLEELAKGLIRHGVEILSTGGTAKALKGAGLPVKDVSEFTGFPEMMDGRVKTLHPKIHGGLLALRKNAEHMAQLAKHGMAPIDLVVVNLYPFVKTISKSGVALEEAIENIDIGGPSMIRSAAKNFQSVAVVVNPARYAQILEELDRQDGGLTAGLRSQLAVEAFDHTAEYDSAIHRYLLANLGREADPRLPTTVRLTLHKQQTLRYGENPHQKAAFYRTGGKVLGLAAGRQLQGKELSFNNLMDLEAALSLVREFSRPAACIIKHTNPCGAATGPDVGAAFGRAYAADPLSAYGGIIGLNRPCSLAVAEQMGDVFYECLIAPGFEPEALEKLKTKKNLRLFEAGMEAPSVSGAEGAWLAMDWKRVSGGVLLQDPDQGEVSVHELKMVTQRQPGPAELEDLLFAWKICKHVKSNAIVIAKDQATLGVGPGQTNRVGSVEIALRGAGENARGAVLASDAFFPFRDGVEAAGKAGIRAIVQPGGSVRDAEAIQAANEFGMAMLFTGMRHFKH